MCGRRGSLLLAEQGKLKIDDKLSLYLPDFPRANEVTLRAVQRFFHATGDAGPDVLLHLLADHMATRGPNMNVFAGALA